MAELCHEFAQWSLTYILLPGFSTGKKDKKKSKKGAAMTFEPEQEPDPVVVVPDPEPEKKEEDDMWGEYNPRSLDSAV